MASRKQTLNWIYEAFASPQFTAMTAEDKDRFLDRLVESPILTAHQIDRSYALILLARLINSLAFQKLGRDPLYSILVRAQPEDVGRLCQVTPNYRRLCQDGTVFVNLIQQHYPDNPINLLDPKNQYLALAANIRTYYYVHLNDEFAQVAYDIQDPYVSLLYGPPKLLQKPLVVPPHIAQGSMISVEMDRYNWTDYQKQLTDGTFERSMLNFARSKAEDGLPRDLHIDRGPPQLDEDQPVGATRTSYRIKIFYVNGTPLPAGTRVWVAYSFSFQVYYFYCSQTKEGLARFMLFGYNRYLSLLNGEYRKYLYEVVRGSSDQPLLQKEMSEEHSKTGNFKYLVQSRLFNDYLRNVLWVGIDKELSEMVPFTPETIAAFVVKHGYFRLFTLAPFQEREIGNPKQWIFFPMEF